MSMTGKQAAFVVTLASVVKALLVVKYGERGQASSDLIDKFMRPMLTELEEFGIEPPDAEY